MFEDLLSGNEENVVPDSPVPCSPEDCGGCQDCLGSVQADIPAQSHWDATGDMWSVKDQVFNNDDSPKIWSA